MNYLCGLLILVVVALGIRGNIYKDEALKAKADISLLQASYASAALSAETHAKAVEAADLRTIQVNSANAIFDAKQAASKAQSQLAEYKTKLAAAATELDLGHRCAGVEIPKDLVPK